MRLSKEARRSNGYISGYVDAFQGFPMAYNSTHGHRDWREGYSMGYADAKGDESDDPAYAAMVMDRWKWENRFV